MYTKTAIVLYVVVLYITTAYAGDRDIGKPTGVLQITEDEFNSLNRGKNLQVTKAAEHLYTSYRPGPIIIAPPPPPPPPDCWALFDQYMAANIAAFQAWANTYCLNYMSCWCCPNGGLCIAFFVKPNSFKCNYVAAYSTKLAVFEA